MEIIDNVRNAGNRGAFYPFSCDEIEGLIDTFNRKIDSAKTTHFFDVKPKAIIAPHAGYVYSGFTANVAHKTLVNRKPETIVVIGPSHHVYIDGVSAAFTKYYETPCGMIETDLELLAKLDNKYNFKYNNLAHYKEHSTETQMPFIAKYNPQAKVVELIYGKVDYQYIAEIIEEVFKQDNVAVVISSDLSHFYPLSTAEKLDTICIKAIERKSIKLLDEGCEACGITGIKALLQVAVNNNLQTEIVDYSTSADATGDTSGVVGYMSAVVW